MTTNTMRVGNKVEVFSGPFEGSVGVIADIQPQCSVIRIQSGNDNVYALIDTVRPVSEPPRKKNALQRRG